MSNLAERSRVTQSSEACPIIAAPIIQLTEGEPVKPQGPIQTSADLSIFNDNPSKRNRTRS